MFGRRFSMAKKCKAPDPPPVDVKALTEEWEKDLKAKTEELQDVKIQLEQERDQKQRQTKQVQGLQSTLQDVQNRLQRSQESGEKLRQENKKKTEQVEKLERNISHMEDRIRNLEIRASEVDKTELTLESTRRNLESSQHECRAKEGEIHRLQDKYDKTCMQLQEATNNIKELEKKIEDLKYQVRHELMKNENIERGLETIPHLKDDIKDRDKKIATQQKDIEDKTALLAAARKAIRDFKDRIRDLEREGAAGENLRRELELTQHEVTSLKTLLAGKDSLLLRKNQALEHTKLLLESVPRTAEDREKTKKIQHILTQLASIQHDTLSDINGNRGGSKQRNCEASGKGLSIDTSPYHHRDHDYSLLERCLQENSPTTPATPNHAHTAVVHPIRRSSSFTDFPNAAPRSRQSPRTPATRDGSSTRPATSNVYRPDTRASSRFPPSLEYPLGGAEEVKNGWVHVSGGGGGQVKVRPFSAVTPSWRDGERERERDWGSDVTSSCSIDTDSEAGSRDEMMLAQMQLTARQKDAMLSEAIAVGDRVSVTVPQKPPRYGRKKPLPLVYTGIVKYVGHLDKEQYDSRVYCGVRLDEPIGEKDGVYKGKRYMFTPQNHAKFFKLRDITSVLDVKSGQYMPASRLLLKHAKKNGTFHSDSHDLIHRTM